VVKTPASVDGAASLCVHRFWPVLGSMAWTELWTSSVVGPGRGKTPVKACPSRNSGGVSPFTYVVDVFSRAGT
jgi:hypothetical protein